MPTFTGTSGADTITGTDGDDLIDPQGGADVIDGRGGQDTLDFSAYDSSRFFFNQPLDITLRPDGVVQMIAQGYQRGGPFYDIPYGTAVNIERFLLGSGVSLNLAGSSTDLTVISFSRFGGAITTGSGNDTVTGSMGADIIRVGAGNNVVDAGAGEDIVYLNQAYVGASLARVGGVTTIEGGGVVNRVSNAERIVFSDRTLDYTPDGIALVDVNRMEGTSDAETLTGTAGGDVLFGRLGADVLNGLGGDDVLLGGAGGDQLDGGAGDDRLYGGDGADLFRVGAGRDFAMGEDGDDRFVVVSSTVDGAAPVHLTFDGGAGTDILDLAALRGVAGARLTITGLSTGEIAADSVAGGARTSHARGTGVEHVIGSAVAETFDFGGYTVGVTVDAREGDDDILGSAFGDSLRGGLGDDVIDGGAGVDVALYTGGSRAFSISAQRVTGIEGRDTLRGIESARFADGTMSFDTDSQAAQIMRLYDAAFDRRYDQAGFEANLDLLEQGLSIQAMAQRFLTTGEFQQRYGALSNEDFVRQLYRFTLDREADGGGLQTWVGALNAGVARSDILLAFSESAEHRGLTAATLAQGLWVADDQAKVIARLYDAAFDRLPDSGGLAAWTNVLKTGGTLPAVAFEFANSAEFQARYGNLTNEQFVQQLYRNVLNREPAASEVAGWVGRLDSGTAQRFGLLWVFSESAEHRALTDALWLGGVVLSDGLTAGAAGLDKAEDAFVLPALDEVVAASDGHADDGGAVVDAGSAGLFAAVHDAPVHGLIESPLHGPQPDGSDWFLT